MLRWDFKTDRIGTMSYTYFDSELVVDNLYSGNALMIACREWDQDGTEMYRMISFWADKEHLKNMLGLNKGYDNCYNSGYKNLKITLLRKYRGTKDIVNAFIKAKFNENIQIEIVDDLDQLP